MKKVVVAAAAAAVVIAGAGTSEARCGVRFGFFPFFASAVVLSTPVVRYSPPPPPRYTERVVVQRDEDGCKKIVKKIYDEDGDLVDRKVIRDCRDRDGDDD